MDENNLIEITGLWKNKSGKGHSYLMGYMGKARVFIFPNKYAKDDTHPSHRMFIAPEVRKDDDDDVFVEDGDDVEF